MTTFDKKTRRLYRKYRAACEAAGTEPVSYGRFHTNVEEFIARYAARKVADLVPAEDAQHAYYIAVRLENMHGEPATGSQVHQCGQCGHDVYVDPSLLPQAKASKMIVCDVCTPEIMGATMDQLIKHKLKQVKGAL